MRGVLFRKIYLRVACKLKWCSPPGTLYCDRRDPEQYPAILYPLCKHSRGYRMEIVRPNRLISMVILLDFLFSKLISNTLVFNSLKVQVTVDDDYR
jgi:hypothetical protein